LDFQRERASGNVLLICNDGGGTRSRFTKSGGFFGVCLVYRDVGVRPLAWCLRVQLCGRCSRAGLCVFGVHLVIWVFVRRTSWMWCSVVLHGWCGFMYCQYSENFFIVFKIGFIM
jgi:hypothetical protein